jgi:hypothetical protein
VVAPVNPRITESSYAGQLTPTPGAMRAYTSADSAPKSAVVGRPVRRGAKSGAIVLAVLLGAGAFLLFANRDRLSGAMESASDTRAEEVPTRPLSTDTLVTISRTEEGWMLDEFFGKAPPVGEQVSEDEQRKLLAELDASGRATSWTKVNLLRVMGRLGEARKLAGKLPADTQSGYSLALLDLAESPEDPPWPIILERLRDAAVGEGMPFLARTAHVYSLWKSGEEGQARAEYSAFGQLTGAEDSELFVALGATLGEPDAEEEAEEETTEAPVTPDPEPEVPSQGDTPSQKEREEPPAEKPEPKPEPAAVSKPAPDPPPEPAPKTVSSEIQDKVTQADALWRGGNRDGALALYRQVVQAIGTSHFLGQRAAARIRQAEREKAATQ